jgi:hypothetical protein
MMYDSAIFCVLPPLSHPPEHEQEHEEEQQQPGNVSDTETRYDIAILSKLQHVHVQRPISINTHSGSDVCAQRRGELVCCWARSLSSVFLLD